MKISYEEGYGDDRPPRRTRLATTFGWQVKNVTLDVPAVNLAASFHAEISAPENMEIDTARLRFNLAPGRPSGLTLPEGQIDGPLVQRAHLYAANITSEFVGEMVVLLRARRQGYLRTALATGWITVGLLAGGYAYLPRVTASTNSTTAGALLLIVPTLLAGWLIRPGEHRLVARVLFGVRCWLGLGMLATLVAVGLLAGAAHRLDGVIWLVALGASGLAAMGLSLSYVLPRVTKE